MKFVLIPSGSFMMGSPPKEQGRYDDEKLHNVTISKPFYMETTQVTQGQWKKVMGDNTSRFENCGDNCPVENVFWDDAQGFIRKLNRMEGTRKYRLPTEAEWEYACRAGSISRYLFRGRSGRTQGICLVLQHFGRKDSSGRAEKAQCVGPLRYDWQCVGMVSGLVH
jgi:formylglycine-generating enzyme required for sulfatase activity